MSEKIEGSAERDNGGPAFPELGNVGYNSDWQSENGMSLRDYFAAKAMAAMLCSDVGADSDKDVLAREAYTYADFMIAERRK